MQCIDCYIRRNGRDGYWWATTQVKYRGRIWWVGGSKSLARPPTWNKCRRHQSNKLQNLSRLWADLTARYSVSLSFSHSNVVIRIAASTSLFSILYSLFSVVYSLLCVLHSLFSILYSLLAILCSLFSLSGLTLCVRVFFFDSLTLWLFALGFSVSSVLFCSVAWLFQRRPQLNQIVCVDRFVVANELLVLKDKQRRHWPLPRSMCASQLGRLGVFLNGNKNGSKQSTE